MRRAKPALRRRTHRPTIMRATAPKSRPPPKSRPRQRTTTTPRSRHRRRTISRPRPKWRPRLRKTAQSRSPRRRRNRPQQLNRRSWRKSPPVRRSEAGGNGAASSCRSRIPRRGLRVAAPFSSQPRLQTRNRLFHLGGGSGEGQAQIMGAVDVVEISAGRCRNAGLLQHFLGEVEAVVGEPADIGVDVEGTIDRTELLKNRLPAARRAAASCWRRRPCGAHRVLRSRRRRQAPRAAIKSAAR